VVFGTLDMRKWRRIQGQLQRDLWEGRYRHSVATAEMAVRLAPRFRVEVWRARLAGLLHDCAKDLSPARMLRVARLRLAGPAGPAATRPSALERRYPSALHGDAGAKLAIRRYGVRDRRVLAAVRDHVLGRQRMPALSRLIYAADMLEEGRGYRGAGELRRRASVLSAGEIFRRAVAAKACYMRERGLPLHPRTAGMLEELESKKR